MPAAPPIAPTPARARTVDLDFTRGEPQEEAPAVDGSGSWVSDLLRRASEDEPSLNRQAPRGAPAQVPPPIADFSPPRRNEPRPPAEIVESLNSQSVDITRTLDEGSFPDLWQRYRNGERNVFTQRLYSLQGQRLFDEIRQHYGHDGKFQQTVDRYIADFEELLVRISETDKDGVLSHTYLSTDTGKVYTMLSHASGHGR